MSRIKNANVRHATYYLNLYIEIASQTVIEETDWQKYEADLEQLRHAWKWLSENKDNLLAKDLFFKYAELGWVLLDYNYKHLVRITATTVISNQSSNETYDVPGEIVQKLNSLLSTQEKMLSILPERGLFGSRNVNIAGDVSNSAIYTGDNIFLNAPSADYRHALKSAYENNDLERAGKLLFEKSEILYKLGCVPEAVTNAKEALKILTEIKDEEAENIQKRLLEWEKELAC